MNALGTVMAGFVKAIVIGLCLSLSLVHAAANPAIALENSQALTEQRQYLSAYKTLQDQDPNNRHPDVFLAKLDLISKYHLSHVGYQLFALKNLDQHETLLGAREEPSLAFTYSLPVDSILKRLIKAHPDSLVLKEKRAEYLLMITLLYGNKWSTYANVLDEAERLADQVHNKGVSTLYTWLIKALASIERNQIESAKEAIAYAKELDPEHRLTLFVNLYQQVRSGNDKQAKKIALALQGKLSDIPRRNAALMRWLGYLAESEGDLIGAKRYYLESYQIDGTHLDTNLGLIRLALSENDTELAVAKAVHLLKRRGTEADVNKGIQRAFIKTDHKVQLSMAYNQAMASALRNAKLYGLLNLSYGRYLLDQGVIPKGLEHLHTAKSALSPIYAPSHPIFEMIEALKLRYQ